MLYETTGMKEGKPYDTTASAMSSNDEAIHHILELMRIQIDGLKHNIHFSQDMLSGGVRTDLSQKVDKALSNPVGQLLDVKEDIDLTIKSIIHDAVKAFLTQFKSIVQKAVRTETGMNDLHYCVVLKEDNSDNRTTIFRMLIDYKSLDVAQEYPISLQIIPSKVSDRIKSREIILQ